VLIDGLFDGLLALGLLWLGWRTVVSADLFEAIILFIILGLFMALTWARLAAPDVALAEAAIGAGLTGALLLDAHRVLELENWDAADREPVIVPAAVLALLAALLSAGLAWALIDAPEPTVDLNALARARLPDSGVGNPVTAVLLNFRGYDTLLEVAVLMLAWLGMWTVSSPVTTPARDTAAMDSRLTDTLVRLLAPLAVLVAVYLLWAGAHAPGGAFQAGTVLAAVGVLLYLSGRLRRASKAGLPVRIGLVLGLSVFAGVAVGVMAGGGTLLEYPRSLAGLFILLIETALMLSIALILALLFSGSPGMGRGRS
jgi:multisubunit Na+/H+ antiporter MnhB subunit